MKKRKLKLVYKGNSMKQAEVGCDLFWKKATPAQRMQAITDMVYHVALIKGINSDALRLCRTTAVIKRA